MRCLRLLFAVALVACSRGGAEPEPDPALALCRQRPGDVASARLTTVAQVRALRAGRGPAAPDAFPGADGAERAAWCWMRDGDGWQAYAAGPNGAVVHLARVSGIPGTPSGPPLLP